MATRLRPDLMKARENRNIGADATVRSANCSVEGGLSEKDTDICAYPIGLAALHRLRLEHRDTPLGGEHSRAR